MSLSLNETLRFAGGDRGSSRSLRQVLNYDRGSLRLQATGFPLSAMCYNMGLMVSPAPYKGTNRSGAISELINRIAANPPDIVGLCEVFADGERDRIRSRLSHIYAYHREGPDEADLESDGGLLLLSKYQFLSQHSSIYRQCAGWDCLANKGVIHIRVHPSQSPTPCDIFFTHTQNIEESGGRNALYRQMTHLGHMAQAYSDPHIPALIMGDLNIPARNTNDYGQMIDRLGKPVDLWATKYPGNAGSTFASDNNFYADAADQPNTNDRLDYILLESGTRFIPIPTKLEILKWQHNGRQISDHYGLLAQFEQLLDVGVDIAGAISEIAVKATGFRCIEETDEVGSDEVSFSLTICDQLGRTATAKTPTIENVDKGEYHRIDRMTPAMLSGDPGAFISIDVHGTEHDDWPNPNDSMGNRSINIPREDLLLNKGRQFTRFLPHLTGDGGEYGVEVSISVN